MLDLEYMSVEELVAKNREYATKAAEYRALADACFNERVRRDSLVMLATAHAAQERALNGVCTRGVGDCPVHQMGSCSDARFGVCARCDQYSPLGRFGECVECEDM